jgi:hypothetical protein
LHVKQGTQYHLRNTTNLHTFLYPDFVIRFPSLLWYNETNQGRALAMFELHDGKVEPGRRMGFGLYWSAGTAHPPQSPQGGHHVN